jgi:DNA polymerase IV
MAAARLPPDPAMAGNCGDSSTVMLKWQQQYARCRVVRMTRNRQIIHVDMDAFYASVEQLDNPDLIGKPVIVGGDPKGRSVVAAASYEARKYGIHSAMPMAQAVRLCPDAIVVPVRMDRYVAISEKIRALFEHYTPMVEPVSIDEAFLDTTGSTGLFGSAEQIGRAIKRQIKQETLLTASVGVAPNKFLAKVASDLQKPDGFVVITEENKQQVLDPLPVGRIWGVGKVTERLLKSHGLHTIAQLRQAPLEHLQTIVGNSAPSLLQLACGIDDAEVEPSREARSLSSEQTFARDLQNEEVLLAVLLEQVDEVAHRLRAEGLVARTVRLKLRYGDFTTVTRSRTLDRPTHATEPLWNSARAIFKSWRSASGRPLRLLGFAASALEPEHAGQQDLFHDPEEDRHKRLDKALDEIRDRYGKDALRRGLPS